MKAVSLKTILCLTLLAYSSSAYSQVFNLGRLKKGGEQKAENNVDKADAQFDEQAKNIWGSILGGIGKAPTPENDYSFKASYVVSITSKKRKRENNMKMKYYFTDERNAVGTKVLEVSDEGQSPIDFMVMDFDKGSMYTFMNNDGSKTMMGIALKQTESSIEEEINSSMENASYTKTGETKTIAGYTCDGYLIKDGKKERDEVTVWISQGRVPVVSSYYKSFAKMAGSGSNQIKFDYMRNPTIYKMAMEGRVMMGMDEVGKKQETHMEVESIDTNDSFSFSTSGYSNMMNP